MYIATIQNTSFKRFTYYTFSMPNSGTTGKDLVQVHMNKLLLKTNSYVSLYVLASIVLNLTRASQDTPKRN